MLQFETFIPFQFLKYKLLCLIIQSQISHKKNNYILYNA